MDNTIGLAARHGNIEEVNRLLQDPRVDPSSNNNYAILWASYGCHIEVVNRLLEDPRVDPSANDNEAILWAAKNDHIEMFNILLPRVVPWYRLVLNILRKCSREIEDILLKDPRVRTKKLLYKVRRKGCTRIIEILLNEPKIYNDVTVKKDFKVQLHDIKEKRIMIMGILDFHEIPDDMVYEIVLFLHGDERYYWRYLGERT